MTDTIATLENRVSALRSELADMTALLYQARLAECPVKIGDIVRSKRGKRELFRVSAIEFVAGEPWIDGNPQRKDGSFGVGRRNLFGKADWELVA